MPNRSLKCFSLSTLPNLSSSLSFTFLLLIFAYLRITISPPVGNSFYIFKVKTWAPKTNVTPFRPALVSSQHFLGQMLKATKLKDDDELMFTI